MRVDDWQACILLDGEVVGAGVLISDRHVLTCAHVVGDREPSADPGKPGLGLEVDFPLRRSVGRIGARVAADGWFPPLGEDGDIAILELTDPVAIPSAALEPAAGRLGHRVRVVGYPAGFGPKGVWVSAVIAETAAPESDWVQLDALATRGLHVEHGFSGGGVIDAEDDRVVGIITTFHKREDSGVSWMLPTEAIARYWQPLADRVETADGVFTIAPLHATAVAVCAPWRDSHEITSVVRPGRVIRRWWDWRDGWRHWYDAQFPGTAADLTVFCRLEGEMDCVVAEMNGRVWRTSRRGDTWEDWEMLTIPDAYAADAKAPERLIASPVVTRVASVSADPRHAEIFAVTGAGELVHCWHWSEREDAEETWSGWHLFDTPSPIADVSATSTRPGHQTCVVTDIYGRVWRSSHSDGPWSAWHRMWVPYITRSPAIVRLAAASKATGHQEIFAVTAAGELINSWKWNDEEWSAWENRFRTPGTVADVAAAAQPDGVYECVIAGTEGQLWLAQFNDKTYWSEFAPFRSRR
ncbi:MAG TPA: trypsin-like peptidase domain-containing protein [Trebonia sp.]